MNINYRTIAKLCFLVVIIGFCMPMACDQNGFQIAQNRAVDNTLSFALYMLFISAVIGFAIGVLLILNKNVPVIADWIVIAVCVLCGLIPYLINVGERGRIFQSGIYIIMVGYALILAAQIISYVKKES